MNGVETSLSDKLKAEYTLNASVLNALVIDLEIKMRDRKMYGNSLSTVWEMWQPPARTCARYTTTPCRKTSPG